MDHFEKLFVPVFAGFLCSCRFYPDHPALSGRFAPWTEEIARSHFCGSFFSSMLCPRVLCALNRVTLQFMKAPKMGWQSRPLCQRHDPAGFQPYCAAWEGYKAVLDLVEFPYATPALDWDKGLVLPGISIKFSSFDGPSDYPGELYQVCAQARKLPTRIRSREGKARMPC